MNPLDWPATSFLILYGCVAWAAVLAVLILRLALIFRGSPEASIPTGVMDLAWLSGGRQRAADAALLALMERGVAVTGPRRGQFTITPGAAELPWDLRHFAVLASGIRTRAGFHKAVARALDQVGERLVGLGLIPSPGDTKRFHRISLLLMSMPLLLGGLKIGLALMHHRPVGVLLGLEVMTACIAWRMVGYLPYRTRAGRAAVGASRQTNARVARAPGPAEMALGFALSGSVVLAGTAYARALKTGRRSSGGSGCGSDSSGCDSDSSSGCSGGGDSGGDSGCSGTS